MKSIFLALLASLSLTAFAANFDILDPEMAQDQNLTLELNGGAHHGHHGHHLPGHPAHPPKPLKLYKCTAVDAVGGRFSMTSNIWKNLDWKAYDLCLDYSRRPRTCAVKTCYRIK